jgi:hypothetical protein
MAVPAEGTLKAYPYQCPPVISNHVMTVATTSTRSASHSEETAQLATCSVFQG